MLLKNDRRRTKVLADNEDAIVEVVEEEINKGNIPTREKVLRKVREKTAERGREALKRKAKTYNKNELPLVVHDNFYDYCMDIIEPNSIDHIVTDPPYPKEFLPLWSQLSEADSRVLKPGGFCITYTGEYHLPEVIDRLREHLDWYWIVCMRMAGAHAVVYPRNISKGYRTILVFYKKPMEKVKGRIHDLIIDSGGRDKELHKWQQAEGGFAKLLKMFTLPGQMILDPFGGSGTVPVVCMKNNRRCLCIEINETDASIIKGRLIKTFEDM